MVKKLFVVLLLISIILFSGCTNKEQIELEDTTPSIGEPEGENLNEIDEQLDSEIEKEMEDALGNITMDDIENSLFE